jgi:Leucine Rich repeat
MNYIQAPGRAECASVPQRGTGMPPSCARPTRRRGRAAGPDVTVTLPSLPDTAVRCVFEALARLEAGETHAPRAAHLSRICAAEPAASTGAATTANGLALAATCRRLSTFYRHEYVVRLDFSALAWSRVEGMEPGDLSRLLARYPRVHSLDMPLNAALSRRTLAALIVDRSLSRAATLTRLVLDSSMLDDDSVRDIALACPNLRCLDVSACDGIGDDALRVIGDRLGATLRELFADGRDASSQVFTDRGGGGLAQLKRLQTLSLDFCHGFTDATFTSLAAMRDLRHLSLSNTRISGAGLRVVLPALTRLESLSVACCPTIATPDNLISVLPASLTYLDVRGTLEMDERNCASLARRVPNLRGLESGMTVSFADLSAFGGVLDGLGVLRLCGGARVGDRAAAACLRALHRLRVLALIDSPNVSDLTMLAVSSLPLLERFDVNERCVTRAGEGHLSRGIYAHGRLRFIALYVPGDCDSVAAAGSGLHELVSLTCALQSVGGDLTMLAL